MRKCNNVLSFLLAYVFLSISMARGKDEASIPLPEHPRPDFERAEWLNLNGPWEFRFDPEDIGQREGWHSGEMGTSMTIVVPFSWGSPLSTVEDEADIGWYERGVEVPESWREGRVFLVVGASDWRTTAWLDGHELGSHQGGYTPFDFELTPWLVPRELLSNSI